MSTNKNKPNTTANTNPESEISALLTGENYEASERAQIIPIIKALSTSYHVLNNTVTGGRLPVVVFFPCWTSPLIGEAEKLTDGRILMKIGIRPLADCKGVSSFLQVVGKMTRDLAGELGIGTKDAKPDKLPAIEAMLSSHAMKCIEYSKALVKARDEKNAELKLFRKLNAVTPNRDERRNDKKNRTYKADAPTTEEINKAHNAELEADNARQEAVKDLQDRFTQNARKLIPEMLQLLPDDNITKEQVKTVLGQFVEAIRGYVR